MPRNTKRIYAIGYLILAVILFILVLVNLNVGSVSVSPSEIFRILLKKNTDSTESTIIWTIRLPRLIAAALLGGSLAVSGYMLQVFFSNPIAGPFVLGISSGAKLVVALVMILFLENGIALSSGMMVLSAFVGSMISMGFILLVSGRIKRMSGLVICGIMIGYICSAITEFAVTFASDSNIVNLHNWSQGSFSGIGWANVRVIAVIVAAAVICAFLLSKPISAYQLGEAYAINMGVNIRTFRYALILISSLLSAVVTAFAGPISFVGIAVPHLMKSLFRTSKPLCMIPACFLGGAAFCLLCDVIARTVFAPTEMSISAVTAVFGAPIVIYMMVSRQRSR